MQKQELFNTIWKIANELRGSVDGWDFKAYVLGFLFYRFISEKFHNDMNKKQHEAGEANFDYAKLSDKEALSAKDEIIKVKGFFIKPSELFSSLLGRLKGNPNDIERLNELLKTIFDDIESSALGFESDHNYFKGLFADIRLEASALGTSLLERNQKLYKVLLAVDSLKFSDFKQASIDLFGDAYEYLIAMYASNAGKSGGEFFTPQEVSRLLALLVTQDKTELNKIYDPACGSGSLLLQVAKVLGRDKIGGFYGQEINLTTYNLCRINMFLHNIGFNKFNIAHGDTLTKPMHEDDEPFEAIVSNPPYSTKWVGADDITLINDSRFAPAGVLAPKSKADLAFTMHILSWLAPNGTAAIVEFPGVLYRSGAEQKIRAYLIDQNFIDAVISLPPNLFFGTSIATSIIVLKKNKTQAKTLFIDASEYFIKATNKNRLSEENIQAILSLYQKRENSPHKVALVDNELIAQNDYNLSPSSYIEAKDTKEKIDIKALNLELKDIVRRQATLRSEIDSIVAELEKGA